MEKTYYTSDGSFVMPNEQIKIITFTLELCQNSPEIT